jgi:ankyrin repeat protein
MHLVTGRAGKSSPPAHCFLLTCFSPNERRALVVKVAPRPIDGLSHAEPRCFNVGSRTMKKQIGSLLLLGLMMFLLSARPASARTPRLRADRFYRTPLMLASLRGDVPAVKLLLTHGAAVNAKDKHGMTALMWAGPKIVRLLLRRGAGVNERDNFGRTALSYAAYRGDATATAALLSRGAKVDPRDSDGCTPLLLALGVEYVHVGSPTQWPQPQAEVLWCFDGATAARVDQLADVVRLLLNAGANANTRDNAGRSPLLLFAVRHVPLDPVDLEVARLLAAKGADVNSCDHRGNTALMAAGLWGNAGMADILLIRGADVNARRSDGVTALMVATMEGRVRVLRELLAHGANANATDTRGRTALEYASQNEHLDAVQILKEAAGKDSMPKPAARRG